MVYKLANQITWLSRLLLPHNCVACGNRGTQLDLCTACLQMLPVNYRYCRRCAIPLPVDDAICGTCLRLPPRYQGSYCGFEYGYPIDEFVRRLKYGHSLSHAAVLGTLLVDYLKSRYQQSWPECFIPVPLSTTRYRERGFNQAIELGRIIEKSLNVPMNTRLLERIRHTPEQAGLSRRERRKNLRNAFVVTGKVPDYVAILDDVITTGSTVNEIARTLKRAGASRIEVWAVARAPLR